jgi:hypothetical protein
MKAAAAALAWRSLVARFADLSELRHLLTADLPVGLPAIAGAVILAGLFRARVAQR